MHKTFLCFYSAISYEIIGRSAHDFSNKKIALLQQALDHFAACSEVLPSMFPVVEIDSGGSSTAACSSTTTTTTKDESPPSLDSNETSFLSESSRTDSPVGGLVDCITNIIEKSIYEPKDDPFVSDDDDDDDDDGVQNDENEVVDTGFELEDILLSDEQADAFAPRLLPSPLCVRKSSRDTDTIASESASNQFDSDEQQPMPKVVVHPEGPRPLPPLPLKIVRSMDHERHLLSEEANASRKNDRVAENKTSLSCNSHGTVVRHDTTKPLTPTQSAAIKRYNNHIQYMRSQITSSISAIYSIIEDVTEIQRSRKASKFQRSASFWSFSPVKPGGSCDAQGQRQERRVLRSGFGFAVVETKEQRITRLRSEGWKTVGIRSERRGWKGVEYYQAYCGSVLDELYLDLCE